MKQQTFKRKFLFVRLKLPHAVGFRLYRNFPKFSDRQVWANSADPDQTAPRGAVWSGSTLFAIPSASFGCITLRKHHLVQLLGWLQQIFWVFEYLGNLRYISRTTTFQMTGLEGLMVGNLKLYCPVFVALSLRDNIKQRTKDFGLDKCVSKSERGTNILS